MSHVFISHASEDARAVGTIVDALEAAGTTCWVAPRDIAPSADYAESIVRAIGSSDLFVWMVSEHSRQSHHVRREVQKADDDGITILPIRLSDARTDGWMQYFLSGSQWIDAWPPPVGQHTERITRAVNVTIEALRRDGGPKDGGPPTPDRTRSSGFDLTDQTGRSLARDPAPTPRRWPAVLAGAILLSATSIGVLAAMSQAGDRDGTSTTTGTAAPPSTDAAPTTTERATTTSGVTVERPLPGVEIFEDALQGTTPYINDLGVYVPEEIETSEQEAALLGAWWGLADWCVEAHFGQQGTCYDFAANFLNFYFPRDPRTINSDTWGFPGAIGSLIDLGYNVSNQYLGRPDGVASFSGRPGFEALCEPSCAEVLDT